MTKVTAKVKRGTQQKQFIAAIGACKKAGLKYSSIRKQWTGEVDQLTLVDLQDIEALEVTTSSDAPTETPKDDPMAKATPCTYKFGTLSKCGVSLSRERDGEKLTGRYVRYADKANHMHEWPIGSGEYVHTTKALLDFWDKHEREEYLYQPETPTLTETPTPQDDQERHETKTEPTDTDPIRSETPRGSVGAQDGGSLRQEISDLLSELMPGTVGAALTLATSTLETKIVSTAERIIQDRIPVEHSITVHDLKTDKTWTIEDRPHKQFNLMMDVLKAGLIPLLVGPAGSGKSQAARLAAKCFGLKFRMTAFNEESGIADTLGYPDANGNTYRTQFRDAWEHGHLWLGDEIDAGPGAHMVPLNDALSPGNDECAFPDGIVTKGETFMAILGSNTALKGSDGMYLRHQVDAATADRFVFIDWDYDELAELDWAGRDQIDWTRHVQRIRHAIAKCDSVSILASTRASINGAKLLRKYGADKYSWDLLDDMLIWKGCNADDKSQVLSQMGAQ